MDIQRNIIDICDKISSINNNVELVAATKTRTIDEIVLALNSGKVSCAGENKVQELLSKYNEDIVWDFIGQLQTNKVKYIIDKVRLIHSVDRLNLAQTIDKEANKINKVQDILVEINSGKEESKGGIYLEDLDEFLDKISVLPNIRVRGMMAVAPMNYSEEELQRTFDQVYAKYSQLKNDSFSYLSMGMSNDYMIAVKAGANLIRLGRAIFGERGECKWVTL
jgi:pyridoxal phosphate enzyme (YggS family)